MKRKLSISTPLRCLIFCAFVTSNVPSPTDAQTDVNVITFLEAVGRVCGGSTGTTITTSGDNISLKTAEVTVDPGTGSLTVRKDGELIAETSGEQSTSYRACVETITEQLGGAFVSSNDNGEKQSSFSGQMCSTRNEFEECYSQNSAFQSYLEDNVGNIVALDISIFAGAESGEPGCSNNFGSSDGDYLTDNKWRFFVPTAQGNDCYSGFDLFGSGRVLDPDSVRTLAFWFGIRGNFHVGRTGSYAEPAFQLSARP